MKNLVSLISLALLPSLAGASEVEINGIYYNIIDESYAEVTFDKTKYKGHIEIPSTIFYGGKEYPVSHIGNRAFMDCSELISIDIPNSITSIGESAFSSSGLTSITIPNSVKTIGRFAFQGCQNLKSIVIPNGVTSIKSGTFGWCTGLTSIKIPRSVTTIEDKAFIKCTGLTSVDIPSSVKSIGKMAFRNCSSLSTVKLSYGLISISAGVFFDCIGLTSIVIPNSVTSIGDAAFYGCTGLTSISIPRNVRTIGLSAFGSCSNVASIRVDPQNAVYDSRNNCNAIIETSKNSLILGCQNTKIPNGVLSINEYAFHSCTGLTSIVIPNSVTSIGDGAFYGCIGLTSINIPRNVRTIGVSAFGSCSNLASICVDSQNAVYDSRNNCNAIIETSKNCLIKGCQNTKIPNGVLSINESAFSKCTVLTSIVIPNSVTSIGDEAFYDCIGLTSIVIPNSVTAIGDGAFYGCTGLTSISIPRNVRKIGVYAFGSCSNLASICVDSQNAVYDSRNDCNAIIETSTNTLVSGCRSSIIPSDVISIADYAFEGCSGLISITIPNSIRTIGYSAFSDCSELTLIVAEGGIPATIIENTFDNVDKKTCTLQVPNGRKAIYEKEEYWNEFEKIVMPSNNTTNNEGEPSISLFDIICERISNFFLFIKSLVK